MNTGLATSIARRARRILLPVGVFALVLAAHLVWLGFFPERDPAQNRWLSVAAAEQSSWLTGYLETQSYWLGLSYGVSLAFAVVMLRRYRERRLCAARNLAIGSVSISGLFAVIGCYLLGCCGSPMLGVYLSLFGAAFLPLAKPLVALLTVLSLGAAWWWMRRRERLVAASTERSVSRAGCECG